MTAKRPRRPPQRRSAAARAEHLRRRRAALKGWETRRRKAKAKARATRKTVKASRHGERARKRTERRLTPEQIERRRREARRVAQKVRRAKKDQRSERQTPRQSDRSRSSRSSKGRGNVSQPKPVQLTFQRGNGNGDPFAAQIRVSFDMPAGFTPTRELVNEAIRHRIDHGDDAPHVRTEIMRWRNPGRRRAEDRAWRQGNQSDAWTTLGNVIRAALG